MKQHFFIPPLALLGIITASIGCQRSNPTDSAAAHPTAIHEEQGPAPSTTATPSAPTDPAANTPAIDITSSPNGQIRIAGKDRWNHPFDTTYESRDFLRNALPILERSLSADQIAALRKEAGPAPADDANSKSAAVPKPAPAAPDNRHN